jgi:hypothetical protein
MVIAGTPECALGIHALAHATQAISQHQRFLRLENAVFIGGHDGHGHGWSSGIDLGCQANYTATPIGSDGQPITKPT